MKPSVRVLLYMGEQLLHKEGLPRGVHHILLGVLREVWAHRRVVGEEGSASVRRTASLTTMPRELERKPHEVQVQVLRTTLKELQMC